MKCSENDDKISVKEYELLYLRDSRQGIFYRSPKVHKPVINNGLKFRPILPMIRTPTYKLAQFLVRILSPLTSNEFSVHHSFSFTDAVSSFCPDHFVASIDAESVFTNIPLNEVIDICIDDLFCDTKTIHNLDRNDMKKLLTSLIKSCTDKLIVSQWVPHWVQFRQMHFYVISKNSSSQNAPLTFSPKSLKDMVMIFL